MTQTTENYPVTTTRFRKHFINGVYQPGSSSSNSVTIATDSKIRNTDSNYKVKMAKGLDASLPYFKKESSFKIPTRYMGAWYYRNGKNWDFYETTSRNSFGISAPDIPIKTSVDDIALARLKRKLATDLDQFKALVPLAEVNETRRLIRTTADAASDLIKSLVEIRRKPRGVLNAASKAWLQFSFAISPTLSDTEALLSSISSYMLSDNNKAVYRGGNKDVWVDRVLVNSDDPTLINGGWHCDYIQRRHAYSVQYTAGVKYNIRSANNYGITEHFGLDFGELPSVAWELVPYSWVVDYFTTMGDYLEDAFSSDPGNTIYCTKSQRYECELEGAVYFKRVSDWTSTWRSPRGIWNTEPIRGKTFSFRRSVLSAIPHRALRVKTVDEIAKNSVNRVLNLASVFIAGRTGHTRPFRA